MILFLQQKQDHKRKTESNFLWIIKQRHTEKKIYISIDQNISSNTTSIVVKGTILVNFIFDRRLLQF